MNQNTLIMEKLLEILEREFAHKHASIDNCNEMRECLIKNLWETLNVLYDTPFEERKHIKFGIFANTKGTIEIRPANMFTACALFFHYRRSASITSEACMQFKEGRIECTGEGMYSFIENREIKIDISFL